jgi:hypothetical protein
MQRTNEGANRIRRCRGTISLAVLSHGMKHAILLGMVLLMTASGWAAPAPAKSSPTPTPTPASGIFRCKDQRHLKELSLNNTGETVEGPVCAQIRINALRYFADFGKTTTYTAGPALTSILPSSASPGGALAEAPPTLDDQFAKYQRSIATLQTQLLGLQSTNREAYAFVDSYLDSLKALINQSDEVLVASGPAEVVDLVNRPQVKIDMDAALGKKDVWHTTDKLIDQIRFLQIKLNSLPQDFPANTGSITGDPCSTDNIKKLGWTDWDKCKDSSFKVAQSALTDLLAQATLFASDSDKAAQFGKKIGIVQYWKNQFTTIRPESFIRQAEVTCGVLFNKNSSTTLKLMVADRISIFDAQQPTPQAKDNLLVVECGSAFSLSAGVGFSMITNREFALVKSAPAAGGTTSTTIFGVNSDSAINPMAIAMAHARLRDFSDHRYGLHFSFGVGANVQGQNSGGSSANYLTGLSISFLRTIYLTGGLQIGKQSELAGGFKVGQTVPTDITAPPVTSSYKTGFGFAITFTKP